LWDVAAAVLKEKFITLNAYSKKVDRFQISKFLLKLEKEEKNEPKTSRMTDI
jgi:hypothetical protein